jgi:2'-hydroxyisoflavone reductase
MQVNNDRAMAAGLTFRPIADTAKDMIANLDQVPIRDGRRGGFSLELEAELLEKWHAEQG